MTTNYFDEASAAWDSDPRRVALARAIGETILREAKPNPTMDILDYGCGTGLLGLFLHPHVRRVTGADSSSGMLEVLRGKIAAEGISNLRVLQLDLEHDPPPAERFHMIVVSMTLHHVARLEQLLRAFRRLLHPGGMLCIADLDTEPGSFHAPHMAERVHHHGFDRRDLKDQLAAAGFAQPRDTTAVTFKKSVTGGREEEFSVFLICAVHSGSPDTA